MRHGVTYTVNGTVQPRAAGVLVHLDAGSARGVEGQLSAVTDSTGSFSFSLSVAQPGTNSFRVISDSDSQFVTTQTDFVTVLVR